MRRNNHLSKLCNLRVMAALFFIATLLILKKNEPIFLEYSNGVPTLDMRLGYHFKDAYQLLHTLGIVGRLVYIRILIIDFVFIVSFAMVQYYFLKWVMGGILLHSRWRLLLATSILRGILDAIENSSILIMLFNFPKEFPWLATVTSYVTIFKFIVLGLWLVALPTVFLLRKHRERASKNILEA